MKTATFFPLHYGAEFLRQSLESVAPHVDRIVVLYTPAPSFGHHSPIGCPETEEQLRACCDGFNVEWHRGLFANEGAHREAGYEICSSADLIFQCDADEVWDGAALAWCLKEAHDDKSSDLFGVFGFVHFWRSFRWACQDVWAPVRFLRPNRHLGRRVDLRGKVYHFSLAQSVQLTEYKWAIHGHRDELRPEWWSDIFLSHRKTDCHPVVRNWWNAEPFDETTLPDSLKAHPYYGRELIQ